MLNIKEIPEHEGYLADSDGNIYSSRGKKLKKLAPAQGKNGYQWVSVKRDMGRRYHNSLHRLTCMAFHGLPPGPFHTASHIDGNMHNNKASNLMWETQKDNLKRKIEHGTADSGYKNSRALIDKSTLKMIRELLASGEYTHKQIGERLGLSRAFISKINSGLRYKGLS